MPLTQIVVFKAVLQVGNRVQIPRPIRWQFRLEPTQVLEVTIESAQRFPSDSETFYAQIRSDGRLSVPKLIAEVCKIKVGDIVEVKLSPIETSEAEAEE